MEKPAPVEHPVLDPIRRRWSPHTFADRPIDDTTLRTLLEAARWAASSYNEQPWSFLFARRASAGRPNTGATSVGSGTSGNAGATSTGSETTQDSADPEYTRLLGCLVETNQRWARSAPVLMISIARTYFELNNKPNRVAVHDVGLAVSQLVMQATSMGLFVHQMAGIDTDKIKAEYALPPNHEPVAGIAIGYPGDPNTLPDDLKQRELADRKRRPLRDSVFTGKWGDPAPFVA